MSRLYGFVRAASLRGPTRVILPPALGHNGDARRRGWGAVSEEEWPYSAGLQQWPPSEPPAWMKRPNGIAFYAISEFTTRLESNTLLLTGARFRPRLKSQPSGSDAEKGIIEMPVEGAEIVGSHAVLLTGYSDEEGMFSFVNSWGTGLGRRGFGKLPYEYFDRWMLDVYIADIRHSKLPSTAPAPIVDMQWGVHDFAGRVFHVHELYDWASDERLAWAFAHAGRRLLGCGRTLRSSSIPTPWVWHSLA